METIERLQQVLAWRQQARGFNALVGIRVTAISEGGAETEMTVSEDLMNPLQIVHGGAIFTLCDAAAGTAAASRGDVAVTLDGSVHYLHSAKPGSTLRAKSRELKHGRRTAVYEVEVTDDTSRLIAQATFTMFYSGKTVDDMV